MQAPWTEIGRIQSDVNRIEGQLSGKADKHELYQINGDVAGLECTIGQIRSELDGICSRLQEMEERQAWAEGGKR